MSNVIDINILNAKGKGITITSMVLPFKFKRLKFPARLVHYQVTRGGVAYEVLKSGFEIAKLLQTLCSLFIQG